MTKLHQTAGRTALGNFAPAFAEYNDDILFGDKVWGDETLSPKLRSLITISVFMGRGLTTDALKHHLTLAKKNGVTKEEIAAVITQDAFYAGWPMGWAVFNMAKEIWAEEEPAQSEKDRFQQEIFFPIGQPNDAYAKYFKGQSYLAPVSASQIKIFNVTFEPGCRNNWHIHHARSGGGQILICVGGRGWYQAEGQEAEELVPGKVINIPAEVKHWHGAARDSWMAHLAFDVPGEEASTEWCEAVDDDAYDKLP
jgi:4-carboxymuconolactone decarboxylase